MWLKQEPPKASFMSLFNSHMTGTQRLTEYAGELPLFPSDPCNRERARKNERRGKGKAKRNERMKDKGKKKRGKIKKLKDKKN